MIPPTRQRRFGFGTQKEDPSLSREVACPRDYPMTSRRTSCFRRPRQQAVFVHEADIVRPSHTARLWTEEVYRARAIHTAAGVIALERQRAPLVQCDSRPAGESYGALFVVLSSARTGGRYPAHPVPPLGAKHKQGAYYLHTLYI